MMICRNNIKLCTCISRVHSYFFDKFPLNRKNQIDTFPKQSKSRNSMHSCVLFLQLK